MQKPGGRIRPCAEAFGSPTAAAYAVVVMSASSPFGSLFYLYAKPLVLDLQAFEYLVAIEILQVFIETLVRLTTVDVPA